MSAFVFYAHHSCVVKAVCVADERVYLVLYVFHSLLGGKRCNVVEELQCVINAEAGTG